MVHDRVIHIRGESMDDIYKRNVEMIYRICFMYLKNSADTEDAVQSIFLKLWMSNTSFADPEHEKAWLIVTTRNYSKDLLKSWWRTRKVELTRLPEAVWRDNDGNRSREVLDQLLLLPEKYKIVLYLYYFEEYSVREIANMLTRKESTIQSQLAKGRTLMKLSLGGHYDK